MVIKIILLVIGLILVVYSSNKFVNASTSLATSFKIPSMVIALTIASFSTCAPELAISFNSIMSNDYDITLANVVGSCVVNILLIIGVASLVKPIKIKTATVTNELPFLFITTSVFSLLFLDNVLSRFDALILIFLFVIFCIYLCSMVKRFQKLDEEKPKYSRLKSLVITFLSILVIILASDLVVDSALFISEKLNVSAKLISMVLIVIGTSLPELMITVVSAKKGEFDMTVGNIIGTNIFNICIVLGLPILIFGDIHSLAFNYIDFSVVVLGSLLFYVLGKSEREISRYECILMLFVFALYYAYLYLI